LGYTNPTAIQEKAIPIALGKRDIIGVAKVEQEKVVHFYFLF